MHVANLVPISEVPHTTDVVVSVTGWARQRLAGGIGSFPRVEHRRGRTDDQIAYRPGADAPSPEVQRVHTGQGERADRETRRGPEPRAGTTLRPTHLA